MYANYSRLSDHLSRNRDNVCLRHLTDLKIQPVEAECLNKPEDSFAEEPRSFSKSRAQILETRRIIIRVDTKWSFVLVEKGYY